MSELPLANIAYAGWWRRAAALCCGSGSSNSEREGLIGYRAAFSRSALMWAFGLLVIPAVLDYLWPLWDKQNQAWHDKYAKSIVVRV